MTSNLILQLKYSYLTDNDMRDDEQARDLVKHNRDNIF